MSEKTNSSIPVAEMMSAKKSSAETVTAPRKAPPPPPPPSPVDDDLDIDRVIFLGVGLVLFGMIGFYFIPHMIEEDAEGSKLVNSFYCSIMTLTTIGFGDICPGPVASVGRTFLLFLPIAGLGFFCGPVLSLASHWKHQVPGGISAVATITLVIGVAMFTTLEGLSYSEAIQMCIITGTTVGFGRITPSSDVGRIALAIYAILVCGVFSGFLEPGRKYLEDLCKKPQARLDKRSSEHSE